MNAVRIRKRLEVPIPELPELGPMIGKEVEIIVLEESIASAAGARSALSHSTLDQSESRTVRFEDLKGGWPQDQLHDGFEEEVDRMRSEPWRVADTEADRDATTEN